MRITASQQSNKNGVVYTPKNLADYVAKKSALYLSSDSEISIRENLSILDPAAGDGRLLLSVMNVFSEKVDISHHIVCGIDIDSDATELARKRIRSSYDEADLRFLSTNSLYPEEGISLLEGWNHIFEEFDLQGGFDFLIANPPWGADMSSFVNKLSTEEYSTLQGQVDSYELFMELATKIVRRDGYFSFIIPDSILNHGKKRVRRLLLDNVQIAFIARLGEKIFPGINRGCVVLICRNSIPNDNSTVDCFRLLKKDRRLVLSGDLSFSEAESASLHKVPQNRFRKNSNYQFNLDLRESERPVLAKIRSSSKSFSDILESTRGVELGVSGEIIQCDNCGKWRPASKKQLVKCYNCSHDYDPDSATKDVIVHDEEKPNSVSLITGRDLRRYEYNPSRYITINREGINYKSPEVYKPPKILVRKTGVGITATIDYTSAYTTQVVYILRPKDDADITPEFILALLNSRAYYFFLGKQSGEMEWRSHPYLTQSQILGLPLPNIEATKNRAIIRRITGLLQPALRDDYFTNRIDFEIELDIAQLFGLTKRDYRIIFNMIDESDDLVPIRELKRIDFQDFLQELSG